MHRVSHCPSACFNSNDAISVQSSATPALDPQLICYSWISGIPEAALIVFVRKHAHEFQYLRPTIAEEQRQEYGRLVETTVNQIEAGQFNPHSGIRFPQNGCVRPLGLASLQASTAGLESNHAGDSTYHFVEGQLSTFTSQRNALAAQMLSLLEGAAFQNQPIPDQQALQLIQQAQALLDSVQNLANNP